VGARGLGLWALVGWLLGVRGLGWWGARLVGDWGLGWWALVG
jgi:hypothetical protein